MRALHFLKTLGAGASGTVYLAEFSSDQGFRRNVAVKVLLANRPDHEMFLSRIRDEARLLGLLQDDAILKVLDMVRIEGMDAIVMEYVEGTDLDSLIAGGHAPSPRALCELGAAVAGALSRAHQATHPRDGTPLNVIHRDVKPANIMITRSGGVKLLDFGVARARFESRESYTGHLMLGTLNYMAPEYIVTSEVSPAADVYGLALSLWEVAAGQTFGQPKVRQHAHEERLAERLKQLQSTHPQLVSVIASMLQWDPSARPTAHETEALLLAAADQLPGASLRSWAMAAVTQALSATAGTPDQAELLGKTISISSGAEQPLAPPELHQAPIQHGEKTEPTPSPRDTLPRTIRSRSSSPPPSSQPTSSTQTMDVLVVVLKGLLIGGSIGFFIIVLLTVWLLTR